MWLPTHLKQLGDDACEAKQIVCTAGRDAFLFVFIHVGGRHSVLTPVCKKRVQRRTDNFATFPTAFNACKKTPHQLHHITHHIKPLKLFLNLYKPTPIMRPTHSPHQQQARAPPEGTEHAQHTQRGWAARTAHTAWVGVTEPRLLHRAQCR